MTTQRLRPLARLTFGNPLSAVYLALVALAVAFVTVVTLFAQHEDASFAGVYVIFLAAPTIFLFFMGGSVFGPAVAEASWFLYAALTVSVLAQSLALGAFLRFLRGRPAQPRPRSTPVR